jgi:hypothetical protein
MVRVALASLVIAGVAGCGGDDDDDAAPTATTAGASGGSGVPADLCSVLTPEVVQQVTGVAVTREAGAAGCQYDGPDGLLVSAVSAPLGGSGP